MPIACRILFVEPLSRLGGVSLPERAIDILKKALRKNPRKAIVVLWAIGDAQVVAGYYEAPIETSNQAILRNPDSMYPQNLDRLAQEPSEKNTARASSKSAGPLYPLTMHI